ncbi:unnamed protein product [Schistosoma turkestanicum]|nr:unnamed protein product [Schistosoma turkestanicum]CAH8548188.1 unnamed protein product [Schistosoma turkestanicum]
MTRGPDPQSSIEERIQNLDPSKCNFFTQFPLSKETLKGLKMSGYTKPTTIQKLVIKPALLGQDVVAQAPTGSGKTIAFVIPVLELLHQNKVSMLDGPVAIILTPTRELSRQIYSVFTKVAREHRFTMMNIMGGKVTYWDEDLANLAGRQARACDLNVEYKKAEIEKVYRDTIGINTADNNNVTSAVKSWFDEYKWYNFKSNKCQGRRNCLHYKKMVSSEAEFIGCAVGRCGHYTQVESGQIIVCYYSPIFPESKLQRKVSKESSSLLARKLDLTQSARLAFTAYLRDYCLMARRKPVKQQQQHQQQQPNETLNVFNVKDLPIEKYANSLGLPFISSLPKEYIQLVPDSMKFIKTFPSITSNLPLDNNVDQLSDVNPTTTTATTTTNTTEKAFHLGNVDQNQDNDDDDDDDNLLIKKNSSDVVVSNSTGLKLLDFVQNSSTDDDHNDDVDKDSQSKFDPYESSRKSNSKTKNLTRVQLAKKELKQKIRSHRKLEFDEEGHVICEKIGDIPIAKPPLIPPVDDVEMSEPTSFNEALNIDRERRLLHEIIDKEDKKLWRQRIRERHRAERKKLKEERKKLSQSNGPKVTLKEENSTDSNMED